MRRLVTPFQCEPVELKPIKQGDMGIHHPASKREDKKRLELYRRIMKNVR